jgi:hypothetical protein
MTAGCRSWRRNRARETDSTDVDIFMRMEDTFGGSEKGAAESEQAHGNDMKHKQKADEME